MNNIKKQQRNEAVDIFRVICAFLVIIGHTRPFMNINSNLDFFLTNVLLRIAVPFFFIVSGYFFYSNMKINNNYYRFKSMKGIHNEESKFCLIATCRICCRSCTG